MGVHSSIPVHETFQETIQGEGYWSGTPCDFIRLSGCPVGCWFCDTGYSRQETVKPPPRTLRTFDSLIGELKSNHVVISGGEPFIHKELPELVDALNDAGKFVSIETSGCFYQPVKDVWPYNPNELDELIKLSDIDWDNFGKDDSEEFDENDPTTESSEWTTIVAKIPAEAMERVQDVYNLISDERNGLNKDKGIAWGQVIESLCADYLASN